jgi:hypothetical protein
MLRRRLALIFLGLAAVLLLAVGGAWLFRTAIVESLVRRELAARGVEAELDVVSVDFGGIDIANLSVAELRVRRLALTWSFRELLGGVIQVADIEGVEMTLDLTGEGPLLGGLQSFLPATRAEAAEAEMVSPYRLPAVAIRDAAVNVLLPDRELRLDASGNLSAAVDGASELTLAFSGASGDLLAEGNIEATLIGTTIGDVAIIADVGDTAGEVVLSVAVESASLSAQQPELTFRVNGQGALAAVAAHAGIGEGITPAAGLFQLDLAGRAHMPLTSEGLLRTLDADAQYRLMLQGLTPPALTGVPAWAAEPFDGQASGTLTLREGVFQTGLTADVDYADNDRALRVSAPALRFSLNDDYTLASLDLNDFSVEGDQVPTPFGLIGSAILEGNIVGLPAAPSGPLNVRLTSPRFEIASVIANTASVDAALALSATETGYRVTLSEHAAIGAGTVNIPALLPIQNLRTRASAAALDVVVADTGISFTQTARLAVPALQVQVARTDAEPMAFDLSAQTYAISASGTPEAITYTVQSTIESFAIPEGGIVARGQALDVSGMVGGTLQARIYGGSVVQTAETPLFEPVTPDVTVTQNGDRVTFSGGATGAGGALDIAIAGTHSIANGQGEISFTIDELLLGAGGVQGASLSSLAADLDNLRGRVNGDARFTWSRGGVTSNGRVSAASVSFDYGGMSIQGLSTEVTLDSLLPSRSLPNQRLTIRSIITGVEVTALDLGFSVVEGEDGAPRIALGDMTMNLAGGRITSTGGTIDPTRGDALIPLVAEDLDLSQIFALIGLEELTGEGRLSGLIPIRITAGGIAIDTANLGATASGFVSYRSESTRQTLAGGGDAVILMLDALENFQYNGLDITLDKPAVGDTAITLRLQGANPEVIEGHPFDINISLTGDADPLLEALAISRALSNDLLRTITGQ